MFYLLVHRHGMDIYFAVNASYSYPGYTPSDTNGNRYMYFAKVLVGDSVVNIDPNLAKAPCRPDSSKRYNSTVDQVFKPNMFVVYNDAQCYPEYRVTLHIMGTQQNNTNAQPNTMSVQQNTSTQSNSWCTLQWYTMPRKVPNVLFDNCACVL